MKRDISKANLTIIVPVFNEHQSISTLVNQIHQVLDGVVEYTITFIDDGSFDDSLRVIKEIRKVDNRVHYISLTRNFGHQSALKSGYELCAGDVLVSMDGDLQHPPELVIDMLACWQKGYDIVNTCRKDPKSTGLFKRKSAQLFYLLMAAVSNIQLKPGMADFRLMDRSAINALKQYNETDVFLRGIVSQLGFKQVEIDYVAQKRVHGKTKYSLRKMFSLAASGITGFSIFPLRALVCVGLSFSLISFLYGVYAVVVHLFTGETVAGWTSLMAGVYFLGGVQLAAIGVCGEYLGKVFMEVKKRPPYLVAESSFPVGKNIK